MIKGTIFLVSLSAMPQKKSIQKSIRDIKRIQQKLLDTETSQFSDVYSILFHLSPECCS